MSIQPSAYTEPQPPAYEPPQQPVPPKASDMPKDPIDIPWQTEYALNCILEEAGALRKCNIALSKFTLNKIQKSLDDSKILQHENMQKLYYLWADIKDSYLSLPYLISLVYNIYSTAHVISLDNFIKKIESYNVKPFIVEEINSMKPKEFMLEKPAQ